MAGESLHKASQMSFFEKALEPRQGTVIAVDPATVPVEK
jgi:hypothetical protein